MSTPSSKTKQINVVSNNNTASPSYEKTQDKRKKSCKQIIHPIFAEAIEYTTDPFWIKVLDNASRGMFPKSFTYNNGELCHKVKTKNIKIVIPEDPEEAAKICIEEFKKLRGMMSKLDRNKAVEDFEKNREADVDNLTWKQMNKYHHTQLIVDYVQRMKKDHHLTSSQADNLKKVINTGLYMKHIDENDIIINNMNIMHIDNIIFDKDKNTFKIEFRKKDKSKSSKKVSDNSKPNESVIWKDMINFGYGCSKPKFIIKKNKKGETIFAVYRESAESAESAD